MPAIERLDALEILDSRGRPTIRATCVLASGATASASVPSGASTGTAEALELRDGDTRRYAGLGCRRAVANVRGEIATALAGRPLDAQRDLDRALIDLDGTPNRSRLGANALLGVSLAFARAHAVERAVPLYEHFATMAGRAPHRLPRPMINLFSGGKHAGGQVEIQDVLVLPVAARTIDDALATTFDVYRAAAALTRREYGTRALTADEGGLAPPFASAEEMLARAVQAIELAGRVPGADVALAVDVAASHFHEEGSYRIGGRTLRSAEMVGLLIEWIGTYPIVSVEDGLAEEDWPYWTALRIGSPEHVRMLGDDLLCTRTERIRRAADAGAADALLLKVNQVGTLTEAAEALRAARDAGWSVTVSARSGETEDDWLADLAVGWSADHIKVGSITHSERLAKYNRLLAIERETSWPLAPLAPLAPPSS
ncbi:MAG TPA: phosphopyruvate hydratase [Gemmatimonadaceae bacterium]|nr:phosphopyruvate hydratase [Gemmatimonadaceae bacterium]